MDTLFRYSLDNTPYYKCEEKEHIIKLTRRHPTDIDLKGGIFFSLNDRLDTYSAHRNLALTYYPAWRGEININMGKYILENNKGTVIRNLEDPSTIPRSWPSFGQPGGSREVIMICDLSTDVESGIKLNNFKQLDDGGEIDEFHGDDSVNYDLKLAQLISQGLISGIQDGGIPINDVGENKSIGSYKPGSGITVVSGFKDSFISVSVGWRQYGNIIRFRFWYTIYKDVASLRYIYGPLGHTFDFLGCIDWHLYDCFPHPESVKDFLREQLEKKKYPYKELRELVKSYVSQLNKVTDGFFQLKSYRIILPLL